MVPTARVQRGLSQAARCASTGIVPATPNFFFNILLEGKGQLNRLRRTLREGHSRVGNAFEIG